jgi:hypothetical protein
MQQQQRRSFCTINSHVPQVLNYISLTETNDLVVNLKKALSTEREINKNIKSAYIDEITTKFGNPNWGDNQLVTYDNGLQGIYLPLVKDNKITAFILSKPDGNEFKFLIIEVMSENKIGEQAFSGKINFYNSNAEGMASYSYKNGIYFPAMSLKSNEPPGTGVDGCNVSCLIGCLDGVFATSAIYSWICAGACAAWETGVGLMMCIFCVGGPALYCINSCCPGMIS